MIHIFIVNGLVQIFIKSAIVNAGKTKRELFFIRCYEYGTAYCSYCCYTFGGEIFKDVLSLNCFHYSYNCFLLQPTFKIAFREKYYFVAFNVC